MEGFHMERFFLYDDTVDTKTRFVSFVGKNERFDLAIVQTDRFYGKALILDLQSNRYAIIGSDDLQQPGYIEHIYNLNEEEANELRSFLHEIVG
ncbi:cytosolic protein [Anoxybacillus gonensis]|nr:cytosolic protein [Anoxybacillus gonensis]